MEMKEKKEGYDHRYNDRKTEVPFFEMKIK